MSTDLVDADPSAAPPADDEIGLPAPDTPPEPEVTDEPEPTPEPETPTFLEQLAQRGLERHLEKYQTPEAALDGIAETIRSYGRRTEADRQRDAIIQTLQEKLGEDGLSDLLEGKSPAAIPASPAVDKISDDQIEIWKAQESAGTLSEGDRARWLRQIQKQQGVANAFANKELPESLDALIADTIEKKLREFTEKQTRETKAEQVRRTEDARLDEFYAQHGNELFIHPELREDGGLTELGRKVKEAYGKEPKLKSTPEGIDRLELAYDRVAPPPPVAKPAPKTSRAAQHDPATKGTHTKMTYDEWWIANPNGTLAALSAYFDPPKEP
jgi:hypothetical protein